MLAIAAVLVSVSTAPLFGAGAKEKSLYDRLGGKKAITAVVDEFVGRVAGDRRINAYFAAAARVLARMAPRDRHQLARRTGFQRRRI